MKHQGSLFLKEHLGQTRHGTRRLRLQWQYDQCRFQGTLQHLVCFRDKFQHCRVSQSAEVDSHSTRAHWLRPGSCASRLTRPPNSRVASASMTLIPRFPSACAASRPAGPAPTTNTLASDFFGDYFFRMPATSPFFADQLDFGCSGLGSLLHLQYNRCCSRYTQGYPQSVLLQFSLAETGLQLRGVPHQ